MDYVTRIAALLSPRHRHWKRLLRSLTFDPDDFTTLERPSHDDVILCGVPRSGTTLLAAVLFQPPNIVSVVEPWDGLRMPPALLFSSLRSEIESTGRLTRGRLDTAAILDSGRVAWTRDGGAPFDLSVGDDYILAIKWPAFWRYLDLLDQTRFLVCVRHPSEVVASFEKTGGRLAQGLDYDVPFNAQMNKALAGAANAHSIRRYLLYEYIASRIVPHISRENVFVVHYERWFGDRDRLENELSDFLGVDVAGSPVAITSSSAGASRQPDALANKLCPSARALGYRF